jgi:hypothetical protein
MFVNAFSHDLASPKKMKSKKAQSVKFVIPIDTISIATSAPLLK